MRVLVLVFSILQNPWSMAEFSANYSSLPQYVASLKTKVFPQKYRHFCTGSILAERWILTAGHCFSKRVNQPMDTLAVDVGSGDLDAGARYAVAALYLHPNQSESPVIFRNDLALVKLQNSLEFSSYVGPIRLGAGNDQDEAPVLTVGWGQESDQGEVNRHLRYLRMTTVNYAKCQAMHWSRNNLVDPDMQICTLGGTGRSICFGDSGSPLVDVATGYQIGVFSSMEDCSGKYPSLFVRVEPFIGWINSVTGIM